MMFKGPIVLAVLFAFPSLWVGRAKSAKTTRSQSLLVAVLATLISGIFLILERGGATQGDWLPSGILAVAPLVTALVATIAIGLASLTDHRKSTFSSMLLLFACAEGFLASDRAPVLAVLWFASSLVGWRAFALHCRERGMGWHRVFGLYQGFGCCLFVVGSWLLWQGSHSSIAVALLLLGVGIREGVIPVHSWFPRFVEHAPMGLVVAFIAPQLGVYAQLELVQHDAVGELAHLVATFGAITAVVGAILGAVQISARRALAYLIISQTGLVAFGLESHSPVGFAGALLNWQVLALATASFAMALAALEARRGVMTLRRPNGCFSQTPRLAVAFLILGLTSVGFPLTLGFVAEDLLVQGSISEFPVLALALVVATAFNGITVLRSAFYLFAGKRHSQGELDLSRREVVVFSLAMLALLALGMMPRGLVSYDSEHGRGGGPPLIQELER